ncbi:MAG: cyclic nucleotide-binding domain-containing protein [Schwartzia sp.]|nr:cyclic nucleotide-binding domain-containing protein [Schwartzia sp. (in: firmicutes)]
MEKATVRKGQILHKKGEEVSKLEIVLSGALRMTDGGDVDVRLGSGTVAGAIYLPGDTYAFDYVAEEDATLAVLDYTAETDVAEAVTGTVTIAPAMAAASMEHTKGLLDALASVEETATTLCKDLKYNYNDYKFLCAKVKLPPSQFIFVEALTEPENSGLASGWEAEVIRAFCGQAPALKKMFYPLEPGFCVEAVMRASEMGRKVRKELESLAAFIRDTKARTADFVKAFYDVKSRVDTGERGASDDTPAITDALDAILAFADVKPEIEETFRKDIKKYTDTSDRRAKSAEMRQLRSSIAEGFYAIYEAAFFRSMETSHIPAEVRMFFLFGFVDETLAGIANTAALYHFAVAWENDPEGRILPMYDWLVKIYHGEAMPSKNEFDNDWTEYLREELRTGAINQQKMDELSRDVRAMVSFEIHNMFTSANKVTNGQFASFVPVFCATDVIRPLDKCFASPSRVNAVFDKILDIDFSCFYRPALVSFPEYGIQHFVYNTEVRPYLILMPNFGSRGLLWQEIEGVKKTTPAHMVLSIFHSEDLESTIVKMCAQFRWEMCRRIQGVRYTDITEPSLTAEYMNYLQFYKKNGNLSSDMKDRIKIMLQKARNDYKNVFVADYEMYILNEAFGLPRLNKITREILFRYCTLSKKFRKSLAANPQFQPLLERWGVTQGAKAHGIDLFVKKVKKMKPDEEVPAEIMGEVAFLRM